MAKNKKTIFGFESKQYALLSPNSRQNEEATMEYNRIFSRALQSGALLRERLDHFMREQKLWDDLMEKQYYELIIEIQKKQEKLEKGGIKLVEAKEVAIELKTLRATLQALISQKNSMDVNTAQGQAENARFNCLLVNCLVYNDTGENVYEDIEDYVANEDELSVKAAEEFANLYFGLEKDYERNLPENKFLTEYNFADEELRLINDDGQLVDYRGKLIDKEGRYVDDEGKYIDFEGNPVDEEGNKILDFQPFLDDKGNPIEKGESKPTKEKPKRRGRPKKAEAAETQKT